LKREDVQVWVAELPAKEKDRLITDFIMDGDHSIVIKPLDKFLEARRLGLTGPTPRRTVRELFCAAAAFAEERERIKKEKCAQDKARREREASIAREKYLDSLAGGEPNLWARIQTLIQHTQPQSYDQAIKLLIDLRDLNARTNVEEFRIRIEELRQANARKPSFIKRLKKAGL